MESHISYNKMIDLIKNAHQNGKFRKRHIDPNNIFSINKHLVD